MGAQLSTYIPQLRHFGIGDDDLSSAPPPPEPISEGMIALYRSGSFPASLGAITILHGAYRYWLHPAGPKLFPAMMVLCGACHGAFGLLMEYGESAGRSIYETLGDRNRIDLETRTRGVVDPSSLGLSRGPRTIGDRTADVLLASHAMAVASIFPAMAMNQLVLPAEDQLQRMPRGPAAEATYRKAAGKAEAAAGKGLFGSQGLVSWLRRRETALAARRLWSYITLLHVAYHAVGFQILNSHTGSMSLLQMKGRLDRQQELDRTVREVMMDRFQAAGGKDAGGAEGKAQGGKGPGAA